MQAWPVHAPGPLLRKARQAQVVLDTLNDSRSGYMFVTNPLGAKLEQQVFEEVEAPPNSGIIFIPDVVRVRS
jgi:hypothetical protein